MNRNTESRFAMNATNLDIQRSRFDRGSTHKTTFNAGVLVPFYCDEVLPGDTHQIDTSEVIRMSTPVFPVMDNAYLDTYYFFVPNRLLWTHWQQFMGENDSGVWAQETEYTVPQVMSPAETGFVDGSVADYFGIPVGVPDLSFSALPMRAYALIWNEWFRDQNTMSPAWFNKDDTDRDGLNPLDPSTATFGEMANTAMLGGNLLPVAKYHDYFTSCLPQPQKGPAVRMPYSGDPIPVDTAEAPHSVNDYNMFMSGAPFFAIGSAIEPYSANMIAQYDQDTQRTFLGWTADQQDPSSYSPEVSQGGTIKPLKPSNLVANLSTATMATINELRQAFQIQKLLEKDARAGTRYREILQGHFGVTSPDARMQIPEYLGGKRVSINMDQVLQTSATNEVSPQGNTAAYSLTSDVSSSFTQSFTEHGLIIGVCCIRTDHTYQNGLEQFWSRSRRFDYYWPVLANIGEQPVLAKEIFAQGASEEGAYNDDTVFGYQEAWASYRYKNSRVSGKFRSGLSDSLDSWHYADYFTDPVYLSDDFIRETSVNVDRTLAVQSSVEPQFIADFYIKNLTTRPMPMYSIPGLLDHH